MGKLWQNSLNKDEKVALSQKIAGATGMDERAVEKDWWVTVALHALSQTRYAHLMSFKGGTSLSKGWNLIGRFSEDVDIAIRREDRFAISGTSNTQLAKARRTARHYIVRELPNELADIISRMGIKGFSVEPELTRMRNGEHIELRADTHPSTVYLNYKSIFPNLSPYISPKVKIEFGSLSMDEPVEEKTIRSYYSEYDPKCDDMSVQFKTVVPTRTFLEKMFLLHEEFRKEHPRSLRMSRHLYDLERLMDTAYGKEALSSMELYNEVIRHRAIYNHISGIDYASYASDKIDFIPPQFVIESWKSDYNALAEVHIYDKNKMSFEQLMVRMNELLERVRNMRKEPCGNV